jgi:hypothetical protein
MSRESMLYHLLVLRDPPLKVRSKNSAIEIIYYEKRSKDYPQGRKIVTASGILLADDELPIGEFDLVKFDDVGRR